VHRYISPHLVRYNERITLAGKEIEDGFLTKIVEECRIAAADMQLTFFEGTTVAAFLAFSMVQADVLLLEVGMGGRLDATNVIPNTALSIITPISLDHVEYLGDTIAQIAREKAGIIKRDVPCVISWQSQAALHELQSYCQMIGAPHFSWQTHWQFQNLGSEFLFEDEEDRFTFPLPSLKGAHQIINAATAVAAVQCLHDFKITKSHIDHGLTHTIWPARLQHITHGVLFRTLPLNAELWVDGAHNIGGAEVLAASVLHMLNGRLFYLINGRSRDRDIEGFLQFFLGSVELLCATHVKSEPATERSWRIHAVASEMGFRAVCCDNIVEAVNVCIQDANGRAALILVCGSLYLSADILAVNSGTI
jgi:dihydrofolate synthase/folylpolyglutamate synthase